MRRQAMPRGAEVSDSRAETSGSMALEGSGTIGRGAELSRFDRRAGDTEIAPTGDINLRRIYHEQEQVDYGVEDFQAEGADAHTGQRAGVAGHPHAVHRQQGAHRRAENRGGERDLRPGREGADRVQPQQAGPAVPDGLPDQGLFEGCADRAEGPVQDRRGEGEDRQPGVRCAPLHTADQGRPAHPGGGRDTGAAAAGPDHAGRAGDADGQRAGGGSLGDHHRDDADPQQRHGEI